MCSCLAQSDMADAWRLEYFVPGVLSFCVCVCRLGGGHGGPLGADSQGKWSCRHRPPGQEARTRRAGGAAWFGEPLRPQKLLPPEHTWAESADGAGESSPGGVVSLRQRDWGHRCGGRNRKHWPSCWVFPPWRLSRERWHRHRNESVAQPRGPRTSAFVGGSMVPAAVPAPRAGSACAPSALASSGQFQTDNESCKK